MIIGYDACPPKIKMDFIFAFYLHFNTSEQHYMVELTEQTWSIKFALLLYNNGVLVICVLLRFLFVRFVTTVE